MQNEAIHQLFPQQKPSSKGQQSAHDFSYQKLKLEIRSLLSISNFKEAGVK